MSFFVITGKYTCPNCTHALYVADYLHTNLPRFKYRPILKTDNEWQAWLDSLNCENKWHQTKSPVIWKELNRRGGKIYLIGGLSEFWEYCFDYYGFQSKISKDDLNKIMTDNILMGMMNKGQEGEKIIVGIMGVFDCMLERLLIELQDCFYNGILQLRLYESRLDEDDKTEDLLNSIEEMEPMLRWQPGTISLVTTLPDLIDQCDLLLNVKDYSKSPEENADAWFERCSSEMVLLAEEINTYAKRSLRVVLCHEGPICFNASILVEYCTTIRLANIVAVTSDAGISLISLAAEKCSELVENFFCPPVWGFTGIFGFVDIENTVIKGEVVKPYKRALTSKEVTSLPKGTIHNELRFCNQLSMKLDEVFDESEDRMEKETRLLERKPMLVKIRALVSLLKLWFAKELSDDIISLGVCSNGSFGYPSGVVFSQPVIQNEKRIWEPLSHFPLSYVTTSRVNEVVTEIWDLLNTYNLGSKMS